MEKNKANYVSPKVQFSIYVGDVLADSNVGSAGDGVIDYGDYWS